jgi:hypothetical protein
MDKDLCGVAANLLALGALHNDIWPRVNEGLYKLLQDLSSAQVPDPTPEPSIHYETYPAYLMIKERFGPDVNMQVLNVIAKVASAALKIDEPGRTEKRSKSLSYAWFHKHWDQIERIFPDIVITTGRNPAEPPDC